MLNMRGGGLALHIESVLHARADMCDLAANTVSHGHTAPCIASGAVRDIQSLPVPAQQQHRKQDTINVSISKGTRAPALARADADADADARSRRAHADAYADTHLQSEGTCAIEMSSSMMIVTLLLARRKSGQHAHTLCIQPLFSGAIGYSKQSPALS